MDVKEPVNIYVRRLPGMRGATAAVKNRVRSSNSPNRENTNDPMQMAAMVEPEIC